MRLQTFLLALFLCLTPLFVAAEMPDLVLYYSPRCYYCQKVLNYLSRAEKSVPLKDTSDLEIRNELIQIGGKKQVPCLVIDGVALYESDDIIAYLKAHEPDLRSN